MKITKIALLIVALAFSAVGFAQSSTTIKFCDLLQNKDNLQLLSASNANQVTLYNSAAGYGIDFGNCTPSFALPSGVTVAEHDSVSLTFQNLQSKNDTCSCSAEVSGTDGTININNYDCQKCGLSH